MKEAIHLLDMIKGFKGTEVELEYLLTGVENEVVILFVHGAGTNLRQFLPQHTYFSKDYKVLSLSLRGHGKSTYPVPANESSFALEKHCQDVLELLQYLKIDHVHYIGNSAGGIIGYELYQKNPALFTSFTTFGTTAELKFSPFVTNLIVGINRWMFKINANGHSRFLGKNSSKVTHVQKEISKQFLLSKDVIHLFQKHIGNYSYIHVLERIAIPFLLIKGELDKDINSNLTTTIEAINSNDRATIIDLKGAGHMANLDRPEEFNSLVEKFVIKQE